MVEPLLNSRNVASPSVPDLNSPAEPVCGYCSPMAFGLPNRNDRSLLPSVWQTDIMVCSNSQVKAVTPLLHSVASALALVNGSRARSNIFFI